MVRIVLICMMFLSSNYGHSYNKSGSLSKIVDEKAKCDLIVFSYDRPLQLYALLESIEKNVVGFRKINILARISLQYEKGYQIVKSRFPNVNFLQQSNNPKVKDFRRLFLHLIFEEDPEVNYVMFAVDDNIFTDKIDLYYGINLMESVDAYSMYYRLGDHITYSYMGDRHDPVPHLKEVGDDFLIWSIAESKGTWNYLTTVDCSVYRKKDIQNDFLAFDFNNPNDLEGRWLSVPDRKNKIGICPRKAKVTNLILNNVTDWYGKSKGQYSCDNLNKTFLKGGKLDISFFQNKTFSSPHIVIRPKFILR